MRTGSGKTSQYLDRMNKNTPEHTHIKGTITYNKVPIIRPKK